ncbi:MAG: hypothetical protein GX765_06055 [Candidatus Moranbacteria bacterium]|nr:hypothetical protein [Candidatus Moranbacteria bacterium]
MNTIKISKFNKKLVVRFNDRKIELPKKWQDKVNDYWQSLIESGKKYTRGDVFTVVKNEELVYEHQILVEKTDYAHYLYCQNVDAEMEGHGIKVIFTSCLVETSDNKIIFGKMGEHTARAGIYQLCGGGVDSSDIKDGIFDFLVNISKELKEEFDIDVKDESRVNEIDATYLKQGGETKKMAVVFRVKLNEVSEDFLRKYNLFAQYLKNENRSPEFGEIVVLERTKNNIEDFFNQNRSECDEYMEPLFKFAYSDYILPEYKHIPSYS